MNCFNHHDRPAVGMCRVCGRGLCWECNAPESQKFVCPGECEKEQARLDDMFPARHSGADDDDEKGLGGGTVLLIYAAVAFLALGLIVAFLPERWIAPGFFGLFALFWVVAAILSHRAKRRQQARAKGIREAQEAQAGNGTGPS